MNLQYPIIKLKPGGSQPWRGFEPVSKLETPSTAPANLPRYNLFTIDITPVGLNTMTSKECTLVDRWFDRMSNIQISWQAFPHLILEPEVAVQVGGASRRRWGYWKIASPTSVVAERGKLDLSVLDNLVTFTAPTVNHVSARLTRFVATSRGSSRCKFDQRIKGIPDSSLFYPFYVCISLYIYHSPSLSPPPLYFYMYLYLYLLLCQWHRLLRVFHFCLTLHRYLERTIGGNVWFIRLISDIQRVTGGVQVFAIRTWLRAPFNPVTFVDTSWNSESYCGTVDASTGFNRRKMFLFYGLRRWNWLRLTSSMERFMSWLFYFLVSRLDSHHVELHTFLWSF